MAMINEETIRKVKEENKGIELLMGEISFTDADGARKELQFIYRRPSVGDMEAFNKQASKSAFTAQSNLLHSLIVYPEPGEITKALADYPPVVASFIDENVVPFFGTAITNRSYRI